MYIISYINAFELLEIDINLSDKIKYCFFSEFINSNINDEFLNIVNNYSSKQKNRKISLNQIYNLGIGSPSRHYCGCFLKDFGPRQDLKNLFEIISKNMRSKLLGDDMQGMSAQHMADCFQGNSLIVCYYQENRETVSLKKIIQSKINAQETPLGQPN